MIDTTLATLSTKLALLILKNFSLGGWNKKGCVCQLGLPKHSAHFVCFHESFLEQAAIILSHT